MSRATNERQELRLRYLATCYLKQYRNLRTPVNNNHRTEERTEGDKMTDHERARLQPRPI